MINADHNQESFQVTMVFGLFKTKKEADDFRCQFLYAPEFVSGTIQGSWHK
jgi:hypothetical protein